jgi:hypothetical protein
MSVNNFSTFWLNLGESLGRESAIAFTRVEFVTRSGRLRSSDQNVPVIASDIFPSKCQTATGLHLKEYTVGELMATFKKVGFKKFKLLLGTKGYFYPTPCFSVLVLEWCLNKLPPKINKKISRFLPIRLLLGIKLIAIK